MTATQREEDEMKDATRARIELRAADEALAEANRSHGCRTDCEHIRAANQRVIEAENRVLMWMAVHTMQAGAIGVVLGVVVAAVISGDPLGEWAARIVLGCAGALLLAGTARFFRHFIRAV